MDETSQVLLKLQTLTPPQPIILTASRCNIYRKWVLLRKQHDCFSSVEIPSNITEEHHPFDSEAAGVTAVNRMLRSIGIENIISSFQKSNGLKLLPRTGQELQLVNSQTVAELEQHFKIPELKRRTQIKLIYANTKKSFWKQFANNFQLSSTARAVIIIGGWTWTTHVGWKPPLYSTLPPLTANELWPFQTYASFSPTNVTGTTWKISTTVTAVKFTSTAREKNNKRCKLWCPCTRLSQSRYIGYHRPFEQIL